MDNKTVILLIGSSILAVLFCCCILAVHTAILEGACMIHLVSTFNILEFLGFQTNIGHTKQKQCIQINRLRHICLPFMLKVPCQQNGGDAIRGHNAALPEAADDGPPHQGPSAGSSEIERRTISFQCGSRDRL